MNFKIVKLLKENLTVEIPQWGTGDVISLVD